MRRLPFYLAGLIIAVFIVASYIVYYHFGYVSAPGDDVYNHVLIIRELQDQGLPAFFRGYPKLFHVLVMIGSAVTRQNYLRVMLSYIPIVVSAAGIVAFFILKRLQNAWAGLLALVLTVVVARQPLQTLYDGGFPGFISVAIWFPLLILGMVMFEQGDRRKAWWTMGLSVILMMLTHHFSIFYAILLIACALIFEGQRAWKWLSAAVVLPIVFLLLPVGSDTRQLLSMVVGFGGSFPWVHFLGTLDNPEAMISVVHYGGLFTYAIWWGGCLTMLGVIIASFRGAKVPRIIQVLTLFTIILIICSQIKAFVFPVRIARDAGVPLALLTAYGASFLGTQYAKTMTKKVLFAGLLFLLIVPYSIKRIQRLVTFEPTMVYTPAQETIAAKTEGKSTIALDQYLPSAVYRNIGPLIVKGGIDTPEIREQIARTYYVMMIETNDSVQATYVRKLADYGLVEVNKATDPLKTVRLYYHVPTLPPR